MHVSVQLLSLSLSHQLELGQKIHLWHDLAAHLKCLKCWQNDGGHVDVREMYIFYEQKSDGSQVKKFFCLQFVRVGLLINHHDMNMH